MLIAFKGLVTTFYVSCLCHKPGRHGVMAKALTKFRNNLVQGGSAKVSVVSYVHLTKHSISIFPVKENTNSNVIQIDYHVNMVSSKGFKAFSLSKESLL